MSEDTNLCGVTVSCRLSVANSRDLGSSSILREPFELVTGNWKSDVWARDGLTPQFTCVEGRDVVWAPAFRPKQASFERYGAVGAYPPK